MKGDLSRIRGLEVTFLGMAVGVRMEGYNNIQVYEIMRIDELFFGVKCWVMEWVRSTLEIVWTPPNDR